MKDRNRPEHNPESNSENALLIQLEVEIGKRDHLMKELKRFDLKREFENLWNSDVNQMANLVHGMDREIVSIMVVIRTVETQIEALQTAIAHLQQERREKNGEK